MKIELQTDGFEPGAELENFVRSCASFELGTFRSRIETVRVLLDSIKLAPGGQNISCVVQVDFTERDSVVSEAIDSNHYVAIHWALEHAGWEISCRQQHQQDSGGDMPIAVSAMADHGETARAA